MRTFISEFISSHSRPSVGTKKSVTDAVLAYAGKLLAAFPKSDTELHRPSTQNLVVPLSERELEVLRLVAAGKSNQEIANELTLATGTVKKHVSNIMGKLSAESRTRAIARARELNLL